MGISFQDDVKKYGTKVMMGITEVANGLDDELTVLFSRRIEESSAIAMDHEAFIFFKERERIQAEFDKTFYGNFFSFLFEGILSQVNFSCFCLLHGRWPKGPSPVLRGRGGISVSSTHEKCHFYMQKNIEAKSLE